ncbi:MAG: glycoside hydrolase family 127 protein [Clostridia bacterium]|nr:glycoside hydrolase family 127 protein [Clostridia bacterium]
MTALKSVEHQGVRLLESPFKMQRDECLEQILLHPSVEELLRNFAAGKQKAGNHPGSSGKVGIGVFLSAYIRLYMGTGDDRLREKGLKLYNAWMACVQEDSACLDCDAYEYGMLMEGLMDVAEYLDIPEAKTYMRLLTEHAVRNLNPEDYRSEKAKAEGGSAVLSGILYRAYEMAGDKVFRELAEKWADPDLPREKESTLRHARSYVEELLSLAISSRVKRNPHELRTVRSEYETVLESNTYITGGYGPAETLLRFDTGYLGDALLSTWHPRFKDGRGTLNRNYAGRLAIRSDAHGNCEINGCTLAVLKLSNELMEITGDPKYGVWVERLLINGLLAQPGLTADGKTRIHADYFADGALKTRERRQLGYLGESLVWQRSTGAFVQNIAELTGLIAYSDERGISVSQMISSEISVQHKEQSVRIRLESGFPNRSEVRFTFHLDAPVFLRFRVRIPDWADGLNTVFLNGEAQSIECQPNYWMTMERMFEDGDQVLLGMPRRLRFVPVDSQHPNLVALRYGPEVLTCNEMTVLVGDAECPEKWIQPVPDCPNEFETLPGHAGMDDSAVRRFSPYWKVGEMTWYFMYHELYRDRDDLCRNYTADK